MIRFALTLLNLMELLLKIMGLGKRYVVLFVLFSFIKSSFAITPNIDNNYNFGTFTQTNSNASFVLSYDGIMSSISNLSQSGTPTAGKITYSTEKNGDNITFNIIFFIKT